MSNFTRMSSDILKRQLSYAVTLSDAFTQARQLFGRISVYIDRISEVPFFKTSEATFLFFKLQPGSYTMRVRSNEEDEGDGIPPYYHDVDIPIVLPLSSPLWPVFPDVLLADQSKPLDHPTQPAAYRAQLAQVSLQPTIAYPFPAGATLLRGTVLAEGVPLSQAIVMRMSDTSTYVTGEDGEFVFFFIQMRGMREQVSLRAIYPLYPDSNEDVLVRRGITATRDIVMTP